MVAFQLVILSIVLGVVTATSSTIKQAVNSTITEDQITCYSIPYGGIGFLSHLITYHTLVCMWYGRTPAWPWRKLQHSRREIFLGVVTFILTSGVAIISIVRCKQDGSWQFMLIAIWLI